MTNPDLFSYRPPAAPRATKPRREPRAAEPLELPPRHPDEDDELAAMVDRWAEVLAA